MNPGREGVDLVVSVQVKCPDCGARGVFLGLPSGWLPDAPHRRDGKDALTAILPLIWREPEGKEE